MSVSMKDRKSVIYAELEQLRAKCNELELACTAVRAPVARAPKNSLAEFCAAYCATHHVRSVPSAAVKAWRNSAC